MKRFDLALLLFLAAGAKPICAEVPVAPPPSTSSSPFGDSAPTAPGVGNPTPTTISIPCLTSDSDLYGLPSVWATADYLLWWVRKANVPPLVVTGSPNDPFPGALDQPNTQVLFGGHGLNYDMFNGLRLNLGAWLDADSRLGIEAGGFVLERRSLGFQAQGDANGQPYLAAPFVNALTGNENVYFISQNFANPALSALLTGGVGVTSSTRLWSWEVNSVLNLVRDDAWKVDLLVGFRELSLREELDYDTEASNLQPGGAASFQGFPLAPGYVVATYDQFRTENLFNGGQIGARVDRRWGPFTLNLVGKLGLGSMHQEVMIQGQTVTNAPLAVTQTIGGIYAQASNIGNHNRDVFAAVPEAQVNLALDLTTHCKVRVGYTFVYLSSVVRPGDQIDRSINTNVVPIDPGYGTPGGPNRPAFDIKGAGFWAQGVNLGLEIMF